MDEILTSINDFANRSTDEIEELREKSLGMAKSENVRQFIEAFWDVVLERKEQMA